MRASKILPAFVLLALLAGCGSTSPIAPAEEAAFAGAVNPGSGGLTTTSTDSTTTERGPGLMGSGN